MAHRQTVPTSRHNSTFFDFDEDEHFGDDRVDDPHHGFEPKGKELRSVTERPQADQPSTKPAPTRGPEYRIPGFHPPPPSSPLMRSPNHHTVEYVNWEEDETPSYKKQGNTDFFSNLASSPAGGNNQFKKDTLSELERDLFQKTFDPNLTYDDAPDMFIRRKAVSLKQEAQERALQELQRNYQYHAEHGEGRVGIFQLESQVRILPHLQRIGEAPAVMRIPRGVSEEGSYQGTMRESKWQSAMDRAINKEGGLKKVAALSLVDPRILRAEEEEEEEAAVLAGKKPTHVDPDAPTSRASAKALEVDSTRMLVGDMPRPQGVGMLSSFDLALPPTRSSAMFDDKATHDSSPTSSVAVSRTASHSPSRRKSTQIVFGRRQSRRQSTSVVRSGNFDFDDDELGEEGDPGRDGVFQVEREWRDPQHKALQEHYFKPLKGGAIVAEETALEEDEHKEVSEGDRIVLNMMLSQYRSMQELDKRIDADEEALPQDSPAARHKRIVEQGAAPWVPFAVRKLGFNDLTYTPEDAAAEKNETEKSRLHNKFLDQFLDVSTATVLERKYVAPPPRSYTDEEKAKSQLVAFDDDTAYTFVARRLQGFSIIEDFASEAKDAMLREATRLEDDEERKRRARLAQLRDQRVAAMLSSSMAGGLPLGGTVRSQRRFDFDYENEEEVELATQAVTKEDMLKRIPPLRPVHIVVDNCAYTFSHDHLRCAVFQPCDRADNLDQWRLVNFRYNSYIVEDEEAMQRAAGYLNTDDDDEEDADSPLVRQGTSAKLNLTAARPHQSVPTHWKEAPAVPPPRSVLLPFSHPILGHCVFAVPTTGENMIYGASLTLLDPFVPIAGCWRNMRLYGMEFGGATVQWAHLISVDATSPVAYLRGLHKHCTVDLTKLVEAMLGSFDEFNDQLIDLSKRRQHHNLIASSEASNFSGDWGEEDEGEEEEDEWDNEESGRRVGNNLRRGAHDSSPDFDGEETHGSPSSLRGEKLEPGMKSAGEGVILSDADDSVSVRVTMLRSKPPSEKLESFGYPSIAMSQHKARLFNRETGQVVTPEEMEERDREAKVEAKRKATRDEALQASKRGLAIIQRSGGSIAGSTLSGYDGSGNFGGSDAGSAAMTATTGFGSGGGNKSGAIFLSYNDLEEVGQGRNDDDYAFDYTLGKFVNRQRSLKHRHIVKEEEHVWLWVWNALAATWLPWRRIDGLQNPLPVLLTNHLRGPQDIIERKGNTVTAFFMAEEHVRVSGFSQLDYQAFVSTQAKLTIQEELSAAQKALLEKEAQEDETEIRRLAAVASRTTYALTAAERSRRQMEAYQAHKSKSREGSEEPSPIAADVNMLGYNLTLEGKLPQIERSTKIRTSRDLLACAVPMTNRCVAVVSSDYKAYVVIELDRHVYSKKLMAE